MRRGASGRRAPLRVVVTSVGGPASARAVAGLARWLERQAPRTAHGLVAIALVSDVEMRRLNRTFRSVDRSTDVLSFPGNDAQGKFLSPEPRAPGPKPQTLGPLPRALSPKPVNHLGDIAIARGVAARQARRLGHSYRIELRVLALHGLLHLLGYDHERDQGTMRRLEERMRRRAGLPAGVIARVGRGPIDR